MLRDYQKDICSRTVEAFRSHRSVMVQMPTGTGKTVVLASLVNEELRVKTAELMSLRTNEECSPFHSVSNLDLSVSGEMYILIVAHRRELVEQIRDTIRRLGIDDGNIVVCSIQWLTYNINKVAIAPSLVVIDEAHHALAKTYRMMWEAWPEARFLGLTATPCRMNRAGFTDLFDVLLTSHSIGQFIREGWLSLFDYYSIKADSEEQRIIDSLEKRGADGDYQAKELNAVLNKRPSIERLYESVCRYAEGKKGIVYAINIDHAHNIADYYREHGINAVAIDSRTPAEARRQTVEDFKAGHIRIMVSVDLFSEGFDCPDVEFIQLARPTLSLAKYLQMVGRGLRKSKGKKTCVMIDNVGLYRMFGLPAADRDWQAMFEGRMAGRGNKAKNNIVCSYAVAADVEVPTMADADLEEVINHRSLHTLLAYNGLQSADVAADRKLRAFQDKESGLFGLKRGERITVIPQYVKVFDVTDNLAAVKFKNDTTGIVDGQGNIKRRLEKHADLRLAENDILTIIGKGNKARYVDLRNGMEYKSRPTSVWFGNVEMLRVEDRYYSRIKHPYKYGYRNKMNTIKDRGFYVSIFMNYDAGWYDMLNNMGKLSIFHHACILANDDTDWYIIYTWLGDGSIIVFDHNNNYYHVENGKKKRYIGSEKDNEEILKLKSEIKRLDEKAKKKEEREQTEKQRKQLMKLRDVEPFCSNNKWGLKLDGRVIVPPIYRNIKNPVGDYCAVELYPQHWGVIQLDGKVIVDTCYHDVNIKKNGTANLTVFPGKIMKLRLNKK
ncbi:MAG: DEAD/DEAH box helicase [Prevotella sp.]|nr:DEAD/DEAH box helicase [Prevotella sp.]